MAEHQEEEFESVSSGSSQAYPAQCSSLRKNGYVLIKNRPCKIVEMSTSKTGKHGHAKVHMVGIDIFTGKKLEDICPSTHNMSVPHVTRKEYQLVDIVEGFLSLMDEAGTYREDLKLPDGDLGKEIQQKFENSEELNAEVLSAMGEEVVLKVKPAPVGKQ